MSTHHAPTPAGQTTAGEVITVETPRVACDGGGGALGHPRVFLNLGEAGAVDCPYCGRHFVLSAAARAHAH